MSEKLEQYEHHGKKVWAFKELRGKHRQHCLCYLCEHFKPGTDNNCPIANLNFAVCIAHNVTLPVYECAKFTEKEA